MSIEHRTLAPHPLLAFICFVRHSSVAALLLGVALFLFPTSAFGFEPPPVQGHVTDRAGKLTSAERSALEQKLGAIDAQTTNELAVLVLPSLEGDTIEDVAYKTFNAWKLGKKGADNGVLLVIATAERKIRIETGKGVGGALTDLESSQIIRDKIAPALKQDRYKDGIEAGCDAIAAALSNGGAASKASPPSSDHGGLPFGMPIGFVAAMIFLVALSLLVPLLGLLIPVLFLRGARSGTARGGASFASTGYDGSSAGSSFSSSAGSSFSSAGSSFSSGSSDFSGGGGCSGGGGASGSF